MRRKKIWISACVVLGVILSISVWCALSVWEYQSSIWKAEEEGIWVARYIWDGTKIDFATGVVALERDRPNDSSYLVHWREGNQQEKTMGIVAVRTKPFKNRLLVVRKDRSIEWMSVPDRTALKSHDE